MPAMPALPRSSGWGFSTLLACSDAGRKAEVAAGCVAVNRTKRLVLRVRDDVVLRVVGAGSVAGTEVMGGEGRAGHREEKNDGRDGG